MWGEHNVWYVNAVRRRNIPTHVGRTSPSRARLCPGTEHPHACGENYAHVPKGMWIGGTSPRMWGEPPPEVTTLSQTRNIPTHVGRTPARRSVRRIFPEHPHACGENASLAATASSRYGTSPRMWGERAPLVLPIVRPWNIPTHVGRTRLMRSVQLLLAEHPHACGENCGAKALPFAVPGTSPRMWGEPVACVRDGVDCRNIPTHVGRTVCHLFRVHVIPEHPHACGENIATILTHVVLPGTSPRMWGELARNPPRRYNHRNIPTHVGRTSRFPSIRLKGSEHPHACGENSSPTVLCSGSDGTSPRMWGELAFRVDELLYVRNIPTHVGRTLFPITPPPLSSEHPHACGEN